MRDAFGISKGLLSAAEKASGAGGKAARYKRATSMMGGRDQMLPPTRARNANMQLRLSRISAQNKSRAATPTVQLKDVRRGKLLSNPYKDSRGMSAGKSGDFV